MRLVLKQNKLVNEREWENTPKELGIWGLVEREKALLKKCQDKESTSQH